MSTVTVVLLVMTLMFLIGVPIFMSLAIAATTAIMYGGMLPMAVIHNSLFDGLNIFPLLAIPCFIIAGTLMEHGNITQQIIDVVKLMVGRVHGGIGITTVLACMFFSSISGSGASTVAAVGAILIPAMIRNGYSRVYAGSVAATGGTVGILIPPSNPMIIYAITCNLSITAMFTAGFIPGFMQSAALCIVAWSLGKRHGFRGDESTPPFRLTVFLRACGKGFFSLATVIIILGSIYSGLATPVEASVVAILWALAVGIFVNRTLTLRHIYSALLDGAMICGTIIVIVGTATLFGKILTYEEVPLRLANAVLEFTTNKYAVLFMIIAALYVLGMFMETLTTIILLAPVLQPMLAQLGVDPIHFGIILIITNEVGLLTPPLGVNLFVSSRLGNISVEKLSVGVLPYIGAMTVVIILIVFFPEIATWLPYTLGYGK